MINKKNENHSTVRMALIAILAIYAIPIIYRFINLTQRSASLIPIDHGIVCILLLLIGILSLKYYYPKLLWAITLFIIGIFLLLTIDSHPYQGIVGILWIASSFIVYFTTRKQTQRNK